MQPSPPASRHWRLVAGSGRGSIAPGLITRSWRGEQDARSRVARGRRENEARRALGQETRSKQAITLQPIPEKLQGDHEQEPIADAVHATLIEPLVQAPADPDA